MRQAETWSQLNDILLSIVEDSLKEVGMEVNKLLREHVDSDVYRAGSKTVHYARGSMQPTFELRESITTGDVQRDKNSAHIDIYHDVERMSFDPDEFVHGSRYWKDGTTDVRSILPLIIDQGLAGNLFGDGWWENPRPYLTNTINELKTSGKLAEWFKKALQSRGLKIG